MAACLFVCLFVGVKRLLVTVTDISRPSKWPPAAIFDVRKSRSIEFLPFSDRYILFFVVEMFDKMNAGGHFGWDDNVNYPIYFDEQCMCSKYPGRET